MRRMPWAMYLWPGLPQIWLRGNWSALAVSVSAAMLLNLALASSLIWSELVASDVRRGLWAAAIAAWVASATLSAFWNREQAASRQTDPASNAFAEAMEHYLRGSWFEAERTLGGLLRKNARDLDARLMLATLLRHTGRLEEAARQLDLLDRSEGAGKWELEIRRERGLLAEAGSNPQSPPRDQSGPAVAEVPDSLPHAA